MYVRSIAFLLAFLFLLPTAYLFTFDVDAHEEECFFEDLASAELLTVEYQVIKGGFLDVDVNIYSPSGIVLYARERDTEGRFSLHASEQGEHRLCFSNRMSTLTPKVVSLVTTRAQREVPNTSSKAQFDPLEDALRTLQAGVEHVKSEQHAFRLREQAHRNTSESTNASVMWCSFLEALVLIAISLWQVYNIRNFFEVKRVI